MTMVGILTPLNGLECFTNTPRVLSGTIEIWNEHLNDGLECLADTLRDVVCMLSNGWNEHLNDGLECLADILTDVGWLISLGM